MPLQRSLPWRLCLGATLLSVASVAFAGATLYRWVDENGVIHYSDRPEAGAEKVHVASAQSYRGPAAAPSGANRADARDVQVSYQRLEVTAPENGAVLWNIGGRLDALAEVEPRLGPGHQLWFVLDGVRQEQPSQGGLASIEITRGEHTLAATVTDARGTELITSAPISFVVRQTSVAAPPTGPALPKPPKKQ